VFVGGKIVAKEKERDITIIDRRAPRVAIQITQITVDGKKDPGRASPSRT
jgi:hypothetical protein